MGEYTRKTKKELLRKQLEITGQTEDFKMIVREGMMDDILMDDSFANVMRLILFAQTTDEEEELLILLNYSREKLRRMMIEK